MRFLLVDGPEDGRPRWSAASVMTWGSTGFVRCESGAQLLDQPGPILGDHGLDRQPAFLQPSAAERDQPCLAARGHDHVADIEFVMGGGRDRRLAGIRPEPPGAAPPAAAIPPPRSSSRQPSMASSTSPPSTSATVMSKSTSRYSPSRARIAPVSGHWRTRIEPVRKQDVSRCNLLRDRRGTSVGVGVSGRSGRDRNIGRSAGVAVSSRRHLHRRPGSRRRSCPAASAHGPGPGRPGDSNPRGPASSHPPQGRGNGCRIR